MSTSVSLPKQFSDGNPVKWFTKFEICCTMNGWEDDVKAERLPTLLEEVLAAWLELNEDEQKSYKDAEAKIIERINPVQFVSIDNFYHRKLLSGEPLSVFVHGLKRLMD